MAIDPSHAKLKDFGKREGATRSSWIRRKLTIGKRFDRFLRRLHVGRKVGPRSDASRSKTRKS